MTQAELSKLVKGKHAKSVSIDQEARAVYVSFSDEEVARTERIDESMFVDLDDNDAVVGVEIIRVVAIKKAFSKALHDISDYLPQKFAVA